MFFFVEIALYTYQYWPKVALLDQDMKSVNEFRDLAQNMLRRNPPAALTEARLQPTLFKITPKKIRPVRIPINPLTVKHREKYCHRESRGEEIRYRAGPFI